MINQWLWSNSTVLINQCKRFQLIFRNVIDETSDIKNQDEGNLPNLMIFVEEDDYDHYLERSKTYEQNSKQRYIKNYVSLGIIIINFKYQFVY